jgi:glycosyltransferase involved in cell wall biosynthesis
VAARDSEPEQPLPIAVRTAIVHDWFQGYHGAERTVEVLRNGLFGEGRGADIFTFHAARELLPGGLAAAIVRESRLAALPGFRQRGHDPGLWRYLLPAMPRFFRRLPLEPYDLVVATSHAFAVQARPRADAMYVCYCFTPIRYAWLPETDQRLRVLQPWLRRIDLEASSRPDAYVAISGAVRDRISRFYGRDAVVIHPPVETGEFRAGRDKDPEHFVWVHRLVSYKRPDVVVEAFRGLPYRLTMVGVGPLEAELRRGLPPNVTLLPWSSRQELVRLFEEAVGFVHVGEEDFGISMVEALAAGTPVIALGRGGAVDIVRDGVDGVLVARPEAGLVRDAVRRVAAERWDAAALSERAQDFSRERFVAKMRALVSELLLGSRAR